MGPDPSPGPAAARRPDFWIVGAPRCGTTALYGYLRQHPQVYLSPVKELHFFCPDVFVPPPQVVFRDEAAYLAMFAGATNERRLGEASPFYLYSRRAPQGIRAFNPDARIIISLRNPADMMYSMYNLRRHAAIFHSGQEPLASFEAALAAEPDRLRGVGVPPGVPPEPGKCLHLCYRELARYADHVERWLNVFGQHAVHVILFDDFVTDPRATYRALCRFLDVDDAFAPRFDLDSAKRAASARPRSRGLARVLWSPSQGVVRAARALVPAGFARALRRRLEAWNTPSPPPLDPALRHRILRDLALDTKRLAALLNRDLRAWIAV